MQIVHLNVQFLYVLPKYYVIRVSNAICLLCYVGTWQYAILNSTNSDGEEMVTIVGKDSASQRSFQIVAYALSMNPSGDADRGRPSKNDQEIVSRYEAMSLPADIMCRSTRDGFIHLNGTISLYTNFRI